MKGETIRSSKKREYFILSIPCNLTKWMDLDDRGNDELDRGTRSRHLYEMLLRSNSCCISQLFDTFTVISRQSSLILSGGTHGLLVNNSKMATTRCIFTGRLFGIYSEGGATVSRIYTHAGERSCRRRPAGHLRPILFKNWRTSRPKTASDGWPGDSDGCVPWGHMPT